MSRYYGMPPVKNSIFNFSYLARPPAPLEINLSIKIILIDILNVLFRRRN